MIGLSDSTNSSAATDSDEAFLQRLQWSDDAPKRLVKAAARGDLVRFVLAYRCELEPKAARFRKPLCKRPVSLELAEQLVAGSLAAHIEFERSGSNDSRLGRAIQSWLASQSRPAIKSPLDHLLAMELLLDAPLDIEVGTWLGLFRECLIAEASPQLNCDFAQALIFQPLAKASGQLKVSSQRISAVVLNESDTDGTPPARAVRRLSSWLGAFVFAGWLGRAFGISPFSDPAAERFREVVKRSAICLRDNRSFVLGEQRPRSTEMLALAGRLAGFSKKSRYRSLLRDECAEPAKIKQRKSVSCQSDWAELAILRSNLGRKADAIACGYDKGQFDFELVCLGQTILSGTWPVQVQAGDRQYQSKGWTCSCWYEDKDGAYLELVSELTSSLAIDRQIYLSRKSHFALVMDSVRATSKAQLAYSSAISLAADVMSRADFVSREWRLHSGRFPVRVLPVSLAFDRVHSAPGDCSVSDDAIKLTYTGTGALNMSVMFDWHPERRESMAEWTGLTVTESRKLLPSNQAAAFRVRLGQKHQIVSYHNLDGAKELRSVLGQHTGRESVIGVLPASGDFKPLVLVNFEDE